MNPAVKTMVENLDIRMLKMENHHADQANAMIFAGVRAKATLYIALIAAILFVIASPRGQSRLYSYVSEGGMRVITNVPPPGSEVPPDLSCVAAEAQQVLNTASDPQLAVMSRMPAAAVIDNLTVRYASLYNLEPDLIRAVIKAESNFNPRAVSPKGARGLMQLMPETARRYGVKNIFDPEENIAGGVNYLSDLLQMFDGNLQLALSAYNAGENLVSRIQRIPPFQETRNYIVRINRMFDFQRSPFLPPEIPEEPPQPRVRIIRRANGVLEITNVDVVPSVNAQSN